MAVVLIKHGISQYSIGNSLTGVDETSVLVKIKVNISKDQLDTLETKMAGIYVVVAGKYCGKKPRGLISDSEIISDFSILVSEISSGNTKRIKFDLPYIKTPEELFRYAGVLMLEIDIETWCGTIGIKPNESFSDLGGLFDILKKRVRASVYVSLDELEKYVRDLYFPKPESAPEPELNLDAAFAKGKINDIIPKQQGYYIDHKNGIQEGIFETLEDVYEHLRMPKSPEIRAEFMEKYGKLEQKEVRKLEIMLDFQHITGLDHVEHDKTENQYIVYYVNGEKNQHDTLEKVYEHLLAKFKIIDQPELRSAFMERFR